MGTHATSIERTRIETGESNAWARLDCARLLWPTDSIGDGRRHRWSTSTEAYVLKSLHI